MKFSLILIVAGIFLALSSCLGPNNGLNVVNSGSIPEKQITLDSLLIKRLRTDSFVIDSLTKVQEQNPVQKKLDEISLLVDQVTKNKSDSTWSVLSAKWKDFQQNNLNSDGMPVFGKESTSVDSVMSQKIGEEWADLNIRLLKFSGEVRFGDALEKMLYQSKVPVLTKKMLKSVIYTRIDDQIFINLFGPSSMTYHHTTGGNVTITQQTDFPGSSEVIIKVECSDVRFVNLFVRIPSWAVNPTVNLGNLKYVPYPDQYCEVSRMWRNGDEIRVMLKN